jgi:hypothetical protein
VKDLPCKKYVEPIFTAKFIEKVYENGVTFYSMPGLIFLSGQLYGLPVEITANSETISIRIDGVVIDEEKIPFIDNIKNREELISFLHV